MLRLRILTALISFGVLLAVVFAAPIAVAESAIAAIVIVGAWEWSGFLGQGKPLRRGAYTLTIAALLLALYLGDPRFSSMILIGAFIWWMFAGLWVIVYPTRVPTEAKWLAGVCVLLPLFVALLDLYARGAELLMFLLLIVWSADVGAYFAGKLFGRVKLKQSISPGKTWEGVIGGLLLSSLIAVAGTIWFNAQMLAVVPFCLAIAIMSIVGDLTVSIFKRSAGIKDSGKIFPGHGGILDRVDSVAAASPLFAVGIAWLGIL